MLDNGSNDITAGLHQAVSDKTFQFPDELQQGRLHLQVPRQRQRLAICKSATFLRTHRVHT